MLEQLAMCTYFDHAGTLHFGSTLCSEVKGGTGAALSMRDALIVAYNHDAKLCRKCILH